MMRKAYSQTESILKTHYDKLELVAETLIKNEKISGAALLEHFIYKRCFAVVDMGDYGYVSYILSYHLSAPL